MECSRCRSKYKVTDIGNFVIKYTCTRCGYVTYRYK